jgi:hypothetical protein
VWGRSSVSLGSERRISGVIAERSLRALDGVLGGIHCVLTHIYIYIHIHIHIHIYIYISDTHTPSLSHTHTHYSGHNETRGPVELLQLLRSDFQQLLINYPILKNRFACIGQALFLGGGTVLKRALCSAFTY